MPPVCSKKPRGGACARRNAEALGDAGQEPHGLDRGLGRDAPSPFAFGTMAPSIVEPTRRPVRVAELGHVEVGACVTAMVGRMSKPARELLAAKTSLHHVRR
jgi:hypothetical protein